MERNEEQGTLKGKFSSSTDEVVYTKLSFPAPASRTLSVICRIVRGKIRQFKTGLSSRVGSEPKPSLSMKLHLADGQTPLGVNPAAARLPVPHASLQTTNRAREPQLLKPTCLEPVLRNKRSHRNEKPGHRQEEQPPARRN
ncbi:hypothetical protein J1605_017407 [Eschrichtius robustus]|uniref:Uncharacterized protein n=1 Tax=Eschrichtius robustus TaxID=9764 RepID=A0AB34I3L3_ESCRO|nr:hypothetical protein J1605_017407 [Eschrichtius robustus]